MTLEPGTTLGRYQILAPLGHGGMATVYKAYQPGLERVVALKVLRPAYVSDPEFLERFRTEARAIARLRHPHIVQVFDFAEEGGQVFLAMEFIEGGTLKARLRQLAREGQALPPREVTRILGEIAEALAAAHAQGIVHRDVKPSNVMLGHDGKAVVTDFGIAKILAAAGQTQTGVGIGTPEYMSPEQGQGHSVDQRSDIYSLGVLAYELLVGRVPFSADTPLAVMLAHVRDPLPLPSRVNPAIGSRTERVLLRALAKDPAARYESAPDLTEALKAAVAEEAKGQTARTAAVGPVRAAVVARPRIPQLRIPRLPTAALVALAILAAAGLGSGASFVAGLIGASAPGASLAPIATAPATLTPAPAVPAPAPTAVSTPSATATPTRPVTAGIAGKVLNGLVGRPLVSALVVVFQGGTAACCTIVALAASDASGSYTLSLPDGAYRVNFRPLPDAGLASHWWHSSPGQIALSYATASDLTVSGALVSGVDAALLSGYTIRGRVTDARTGAAIPDVRVFVSDKSGAAVVGGSTDSSGNYALSLPDGTYRIGFQAAAGSPYAPQWWNGAAETRAATDVVVRGAHVSGIDARMAPPR